MLQFKQIYKHGSPWTSGGIINDMLIGPAIVEDRMTGDSYLPELLEDVPLDTRRHMYLHQDGNPTSE
jgi:hypothetical protein